MPISGTSNGASRRAIESIVPSPPSDDRDVGACPRAPPARPWKAGNGASTARFRPRPRRRGPRRRETREPRQAARAMPGLTWRPTSATRRKRAAAPAGGGRYHRPRLKHSALRGAIADEVHDPAGIRAPPRSSRGAVKSPLMLDPRAQHLLKTLVERYIVDGQPVGSRALSKQLGPRAFARDDPQRDGGPRGDGLHREPAYVGRTRADAQGLPVLRRQPDGDEAARADRDPSARGRAHRRPAAAARERRGRRSCRSSRISRAW